MASYYNKQKTSKMLTQMSLLCIIFYLTQGDINHSLINQMCNTTYAPNACITCIESDNSSDINVDEDVIQKMLGCGENDALILEQNVNKILDDPTTKPKRRHTLLAINHVIQAIIAHGGTVQTQAIQRKFGDAKNSINSLIMSKLRNCSSVLNASGIIIPPPVFSGLFNVEADYKLAYQLISSVQVYEY